MKILAFLSIFFLNNVTGLKLTEEQKIDKLITFVSNLQDVSFIRNGSKYTPEQAASHLRMKREKAGSSIRTAREFIDKLASNSSYSGKPYTIRYKDGREVPARVVLYQELDRLEKL